MTRFQVLVGEPGETPLHVETGDFNSWELRAFFSAVALLMEELDINVELHVRKLPPQRVDP